MFFSESFKPHSAGYGYQPFSESYKSFALDYELSTFPAVRILPPGPSLNEMIVKYGLMDWSTDVLTGSIVLSRSQNAKEDSRPGVYSRVQRGEWSIDGEQKVVAVKIPLLHDTQDAIEDFKKRFQREFPLWGRVRHENIVPLYGIWIDPYERTDLERLPRLVSPWYGNNNVKAFLNERKYLQPPERCSTGRLRLVEDVAKGLQFLHSKRLVHGNLCPRNIMINDHCRALIVDFGFSKIVSGHGDTSTKDTTSDLYEAPLREIQNSVHVRGNDVRTGRGCMYTDVWSFGMTALFIMSSKDPFSEDSDVPYAIMRKNMGALPMRSLFGYLNYPQWDYTWAIFEHGCWARNPMVRMSMNTVLLYVKDLLEQSSSRHWTYI